MTVQKKLAPKTKAKTVSPEGIENWLRPPSGERDDEVVREFLWDVMSIGAFLEDIRRIWANALGVSGPQWLILMAINDLDVGNGVSVSRVAEKLHVRGTFVTAQTKDLERSGLLIRETSDEDARIVLMSLTQEARSKIARLSARRKMLNDLIFADINDRSLRDVTDKLTQIRNRVEKAALHLDIER
jgi:MarR family transcriptional regulator, organic hydroperoxide resistance regulator